MSGKITYETLDGRAVAEALVKDNAKGLDIVDGHAVKAEKDYENPDQLFDMLIARIRKYHPSTDVSMIEKAYHIAANKHGIQCRKSGEPYIVHPLWVAIILADLEMDKETIVAGLLHDVVEDTDATDGDIKKEFGEEVALLVDGVTKLGQLSYSSDKLEVQAENLRKMFLAMAKDISCDYYQTCGPPSQYADASVYAAGEAKRKSERNHGHLCADCAALGISKIKTELDDLALKYSQPEVFFDLVNQINAQKDGAGRIRSADCG